MIKLNIDLKSTFQFDSLKTQDLLKERLLSQFLKQIFKIKITIEDLKKSI